MLTAYISDVHGNLEALTAVMDDIASEKADKVVCLGDVVGYGVNPNECVDIVSSACAKVILGNHDEAAYTKIIPKDWNRRAQGAMEWTHSVLTDEARQAIGKFERAAMLDGVLLVHGSPNDPTHEYVLPAASFQAGAMDYYLKNLPTNGLCVNGHTHVPGVFDKNGYEFCRYYASPRGGRGKTILNVGSVGQPRDGVPDSCYLLMGDSEFRWKRVKYDVDKTVKKMVAAGADRFLADRLTKGR